jgi:phosphate transport system substrate-binding protein
MARWAYTLIVVVLAFGIGIGAGFGIWGGAEKRIVEGGSTTVQPLAEKGAEAYMKSHPGVKVVTGGGGSSAGVRGVAEGLFDIGAASRDLKSSELEQWPDLVKHTIARDGVAIVVNGANPVADLTMEQIRDIYANPGAHPEWTVVNREAGSGTRDTFEELVMGGEEIGEAANTIFLPSNGAVREQVATTANAIGYISLGYVDSSVKAIKVGGIECTVANVQNGTYPISRSLYLVTKGEPTGIVRDFIDFCLSDEGQAIVEEEGYIRVR